METLKKGVNWPYDLAWGYQYSQENVPGAFLILDQPVGGQNVWRIHIRTWDMIAQKFYGERDQRQGQPMTMPDGRVLHAKYRFIDDAADSYLKLQNRLPSNEPVKIPTDENQPVEDVSPEYVVTLIQAHIERKKSKERPIELTVEGQKLPIPFEVFDAMVKDFINRRADMISAGCFPELVIHESGGDGPKPVEGRSTAMQQAPTVDKAGTPQPPPSGQPHPDDRDLV